nr:glycine receptor subunit alpha-4-like [Penaeus vannamei]
MLLQRSYSKRRFRCRECKTRSVTNLQILDSLLKLYDRRATPTNHLNNATTVTCELYIRSFGSIDPNSMDYQVDLYLRQSWVDERLNHDDIKQPLDLNDPNLVKAIWKPEVYFPNAKHAEFQFVTVPNVLVRINPNGEILYMLRLKLVFACMMELSKFPLDSQVCTMEIASFSKTMKELNLSWKSDAPIKMYKNMRMPQFEMEEIVPTTCQESFQIGNYSCLVAEFHMRRAIGFHFVQSYLPTTLIVVISWVSFWMDVDSVPGRTTLGVTTLLTVSSKSSGTGLPQVSYVKAIDVWMGACTAFVFCALLEFTFVNYLWRRRPHADIRGGPNGRCLPAQCPQITAVVTTPAEPKSVIASLTAPADTTTPSAPPSDAQQQYNYPNISSEYMQGILTLDNKKYAFIATRCLRGFGSNIFISGNDIDIDEEFSKIQFMKLFIDYFSNNGYRDNLNNKLCPPTKKQTAPKETKYIKLPFLGHKGASSPGLEDPTQFARIFKQTNKVRARQIDEYCRGIFPLLFSFFNIFYWCYYLL